MLLIVNLFKFLQFTENGIEILRNVDFISTHLVILTPTNIKCHLKYFIYKNDGTVVYYYNLNNGIKTLEAGSNARCNFQYLMGWHMI